MARYSLTEVRYPDRPARFYIDGKRVSRGHFELIRTKASMCGRLECFSTRAKQMPGGTFKRWNYSTAYIPGGEG